MKRRLKGVDSADKRVVWVEPHPDLTVEEEEAVMLGKPRHGSPCNHCGACCQLSLCPIAMAVFHAGEFALRPCPALRWRGAESRCGMIEDPREFAPVLVAVHGTEAMREAAKTILGAGGGCDCQGPREFPDLLYLHRAQEAKARNKEKLDAAADLWRVERK